MCLPATILEFPNAIFFIECILGIWDHDSGGSLDGGLGEESGCMVSFSSGEAL